jgi:HD superfamily phosphohydrolase YqeK
MRSGTGTETIDKGARWLSSHRTTHTCAVGDNGTSLALQYCHRKRRISGAGVQHRMSIGRSSVTIDRWIREQGYPPDDRVLGHTCNMAMGFSYELEREQAR